MMNIYERKFCKNTDYYLKKIENTRSYKIKTHPCRIIQINFTTTIPKNDTKKKKSI